MPHCTWRGGFLFKTTEDAMLNNNLVAVESRGDDDS